MARRKKSAPSARDMAEIATGKSSARDRAEAATKLGRFKKKKKKR